MQLQAQTNQEEEQTLVSVLKILEKKYNVRFSYADKVVKEKKITKLKEDLTLQEALEFLKLETNLEFELLNKRFITIRKPQRNQGLLSTQKLEEIVLNNYLTSGITRLNDGSINIKPETFGILPGLIEPDVLQTIQAIPGVLSIDETVSNINIRGGTHDQNLILWDGIKMYQSGHFFGLISAFNPYTTKNVNVYKNGTRAKFGDGVSSIIEMQLSDEIDNTFKAGVGIGFNLINADGYAKIPLSKKTELQLSARRSITDFINTPTFEQYSKRIFQDSDFKETGANENSISQNESFYFYDVAAKFLYDITKKDKLRLHFFNVYNKLNYDEQSTISNVSEALNSELAQRNSAIGLTYTKDWTQAFSTTAQVYITNYVINAINFDVLNDQRLIQENEVLDTSAKLDANYTPNNNLKMNGGYQFSEVGISNLEDVNNPNFRSLIKDVLRTHAVYAETGFLSNNVKTKLVFGARVNYIDKFNMVFIEPRLSFSQRFLDYFKFELLGELKSQTTSQIIDLQSDFLGIENRRWILSNNKDEAEVINTKTIYPVPIIKSQQASVGLHYNKNKLLISAEGYIKKVDGITTRSQGFQNQYQFVNSHGSYNIKGVEVLINKQFKDIVSTWVSYTFNKNEYIFEDLNDGKPFPNNTDIRHALTFAGTYTYEKIKLALSLNWHSGIPNTEPAFNDDPNDAIITYASPNGTNVSDYLRTDCSLTYAFNINDDIKATIGASIWNLFNKKNIINTYYVLNDLNEVITIENKSLGITPNLSFRVFL